MSDSAPNVEIEDVLSSIRRLVSGDDWSRQPPVSRDDGAAPAKPADPPPQGQDKFVLTPVLRVVPVQTAEPVTEAEPDITEAEGAQDWHLAFPEVDEASDQEPAIGEDIIAAKHDAQSASAPAMAPQPEAEPEQALTPDPVQPAAKVHAAPSQARPLTLTDRIVADAPRAEPTSMARPDLEATIAELEAALGDQADEFEPDGSEESDEAPVLASWRSSQRSAPQLPTSVEDAEQISQDEDDDDHPEEEVTFHHIGHEFTRGDAVDSLAEDLDDTEDPQGYDDDLTGLLETGGVVDEQILRDMVAEIVRQELQGPLGERITRNVRKLVRREIFRVLSSQEFD